jgi:hemolysin III
MAAVPPLPPTSDAEQPPASTDPRRAVLRRSVHTELALASPRPRLRGWSHLGAAVLTLPLVAWWVASVPAGTPRWAVGAFGGGMAVMFVCSALLHLTTWSPRWHERLLRVDHTGIFLAIAGTGVAIALLGLTGWPSVALLVVALGGAVAGITAEWLPFAPPRGFSNTVYLTMGWLPVLLLPWLWTTSGATAVGLLLLGGAFYTVGAVVVGLRRPDLAPGWFGYHELFHVLVIAAAVTHAMLVHHLVARAG